MIHKLLFLLTACVGIVGWEARATAACQPVTFGDPVVTCETSIGSFTDTISNWMDTGARAAVSQVIGDAINDYILRHSTSNLLGIKGNGIIYQSWEGRAPTDGESSVRTELDFYGPSGSVYIETRAHSVGGILFPDVGSFDIDDDAGHQLYFQVARSSYDLVRNLVSIVYELETSSYARDAADDGSAFEVSRRTNLGEFSIEVPLSVPSPTAGAGLPLMIGIGLLLLWRSRSENGSLTDRFNGLGNDRFGRTAYVLPRIRG